MNATGIIALAGAHGVTLTADAKRIISKPAAGLSPDVREAIRNHSAQLLELLSHDNRPTSIDPDTEPPRHVVECGRSLSNLYYGARDNMTDELRQVIQRHAKAPCQSIRH